LTCVAMRVRGAGFALDDSGAPPGRVAWFCLIDALAAEPLDASSTLLRLVITALLPSANATALAAVSRRCKGEWQAIDEDQLAALATFKQGNGHCKVPMLYAPRPLLGLWLECQRVRKKNGCLARHCCTALVAIGHWRLEAEKVDKLAALAMLDTKPAKGVKVAVACASGGVSQEDLGLFWGRIRANFGPDPARATTKLTEEEMAPLRPLPWVMREMEAMGTEVALAMGTEVATKATKVDKLAALAKLNAKPRRRVKVAVACASGGESLEDLGSFWNNIRANFGPDPARAHVKLTEAEMAPLRQLAWVMQEVHRMND